MGLSEANQDLCQQLDDVVLNLGQAATLLLSLTKGCEGDEITATLKLMATLYEDADRLAALADEVKAGSIMRAR